MAPRKHIKVTYSTLGSPDPLLHEYYEEAVAAARANLGQTHQLYIDGQWTTAARTFTTHSPIDTGVVMGHFQDGDAGDIDRAVRAARAAFPAWRATPWPERVALLRRVAELISERLFDIAAVDSLEVGKNRLEALGDVEEAADFIRAYCDVMEAHGGFVKPQGRESERHRNTSILKPYGVWGVIAPFNFPVALSGGPTAAALLAGNTVVLKPAEDSPYSPTLLVQCFHDAGIPAGRGQPGHRPEGDRVAPWSIIRAWMASPSPAATRWAWRSTPRWRRGRARARCWPRWAARTRRSSGPAPTWPWPPRAYMRAAFGLTGQKCSACSRVLVHESIKDAFVAQLVALTQQIAIGDPTQRDVWIGPVINGRAYENYQRFTDELRAHGKIAFGGATLATHGYYVAPTVVTDLPDDHYLWRQEMFLPIVMVDSFTDFDCGAGAGKRCRLRPDSRLLQQRRG
jgi:1-pyrroline-5-carboxylate dehydrogenase